MATSNTVAYALFATFYSILNLVLFGVFLWRAINVQETSNRVLFLILAFTTLFLYGIVMYSAFLRYAILDTYGIYYG